MANGTVVLIHPTTGKTKEVPVGFSWTILFFGVFVPLFRGDILFSIVYVFLVFITGGIAFFIFPFVYNWISLLILLNQGYVDERDLADKKSKPTDSQSMTVVQEEQKETQESVISSAPTVSQSDTKDPDAQDLKINAALDILSSDEAPATLTTISKPTTTLGEQTQMIIECKDVSIQKLVTVLNSSSINAKIDNSSSQGEVIVVKGQYMYPRVELLPTYNRLSIFGHLVPKTYVNSEKLAYVNSEFAMLKMISLVSDDGNQIILMSYYLAYKNGLFVPCFIEALERFESNALALMKSEVDWL